MFCLLSSSVHKTFWNVTSLISFDKLFHWLFFSSPSQWHQRPVQSPQGILASCGLWAEESQHGQPGPALLVPVATLLCLCSATAAIATVWIGPPQPQEEGFSLEVASFASENYFLLLKAVEIRPSERVKHPVHSLPALWKLSPALPLQNISGGFGVCLSHSIKTTIAQLRLSCIS